MSKFICLLSALFLFTANTLLAKNRIVYPFGAATIVVKSSESFESLVQSTKPIDKAILKGVYNSVVLKIVDQKEGKFIYDQFTSNSVNRIVKLRVPKNTPEELYTLLLISDNDTIISTKSVKTIRKFKQDYSFIHITDLHITRLWLDEGYPKELELLDAFIDVANIINPEFILNTGDQIHDYTRFKANKQQWGGYVSYAADTTPNVEDKYRCYYHGSHGYRGVYGFESPLITTTGNHDFYGLSKKDPLAICKQYNHYMGLRTYGFTYGDLRIVATDDYLENGIRHKVSDFSQIVTPTQLMTINNFFKEKGDGKLRIWIHHNYKFCDIPFMSRYRFDASLTGNYHDPKDTIVNNMLISRPGVLCRSGEIKRWKKVLGLFRIFTIKDNKLSSSKPIRFCSNPTADIKDIDVLLKVAFANKNDGSHSSNIATITNRLDADLSGCKIRFLMPRAKYKINNGELLQSFDGEFNGKPITVVDILLDISSNQTATIRIDKASK